MGFKVVLLSKFKQSPNNALKRANFWQTQKETTFFVQTQDRSKLRFLSDPFALILKFDCKFVIPFIRP